jgi:putative uncharacterized protein FNV0124
MMERKIGRPISGKVKNFDLKVRVDEDINEKLLAYCEKQGQTKAEVIRELLEEKFGDKQYEQVEKKVMYKDSGNNWSTVQIVLPISWVKDMGVNKDDKDVVLFYNDKDKEIIIKKSK